jgi:hypothetical protein
MDRVDNLVETVQREVEDYAAGGDWKARTYAVSDPERQIYTVITIPDYPRPFSMQVVVMARVIDGYVVIEGDITDRPLINELLRVGIPRDRIIRTYAGEEPPDHVDEE